MKLKPKHFEIAKTISYFVDRNYYPDFVEPTREQIDLFTQIESRGSKHLNEDQLKLVEPMLNGKQLYDLQIKMIHEELAEWVSGGHGWYPVMASLLLKIYPERHKCPSYVKMLMRLKKKMEKESGLVVMMGYSGFTDEVKDNLFKNYFKNI
jgi:hypothetical protein